MRNIYWPNFDQNYSGMAVLLVLFTQDECPPCKAQEKILQDLIQRMDPHGKIEFYYSDTLMTPGEVIEKYHLRGVPAIAVFEKGELAELVVGAQTEQYTEMLYSKWLEHYNNHYA
ncbi:thioredoxin [Alcanivorax sp. S71-1-4]|uniref:thioredoxin family protein n=1 Tax=Alcanivorax sp. S71-1-4 TaxID=1177159 RepID=UPI00135B8D0F|nr:thioredoxin family protein [Alcanivorax sp. S71-1-4]KAF0805193.1 thioredoxin [Alcanivorax sp. S71-1-4]